MTIRVVRIQFSSSDSQVAAEFADGFAGFEYWIKDRLRSVRDRLRGEEAKGVDGVVFDFRTPGRPGLAERNRWTKLLNIFYWAQDVELAELTPGDAVANLVHLMGRSALACEAAPWPQVRALGAVLSPELEERELVALKRQVSSVLRTYGSKRMQS